MKKGKLSIIKPQINLNKRVGNSSTKGNMTFHWNKSVTCLEFYTSSNPENGETIIVVPDYE